MFLPSLEGRGRGWVNVIYERSKANSAIIGESNTTNDRHPPPAPSFKGVEVSRVKQGLRDDI